MVHALEEDLVRVRVRVRVSFRVRANLNPNPDPSLTLTLTLTLNPNPNQVTPWTDFVLAWLVRQTGLRSKAIARLNGLLYSARF